MKISKVFCDHCGNVLDEAYDYVDLKIEANHKTHDVDLCSDCFEKLNNVIGKFCSNQKTIGANKCNTNRTIKGNEYLNGIYSKDVKLNG